jgi:transposase
VRLVIESGSSIAHIAKDLGIHREALRQWVREAEADNGSRLDRVTSDEHERLKALERENRECARPVRS